MLELLKYLNLPSQIALGLAGLFLILQLVGELLELKGKMVPEFMKIRKRIARKKAERKDLAQIKKTLLDVQVLLADVRAHYDADNISKRDQWISDVNSHLKRVEELDKKLLSLIIENKRNAIINFAALVIDEKTPVTREQYTRIFKTYQEYEEIIEAYGMTNGEVVVAMRIITESYETHMRNHTFIEDIRGYNVTHHA